tara:strand:- start:66 stop:242 length:177 start_codon:yes stop_codon:yes gene_type:complete
MDELLCVECNEIFNDYEGFEEHDEDDGVVTCLPCVADLKEKRNDDAELARLLEQFGLA